ncbi:MAG: hypothetical protein ABJ275_10855 [Maricaulaceae bacterium]
MSAPMKRTFAVTAAIALCVLALYFMTDKHLQTHYMLLTNQSEKSVCVQSNYFERETFLSSQNKKIEFRVKGDGGFTITNCDGETSSQKIGYFTTNDPRCHLIEYIDDSKIIYETTAVKECR